MDVTHVVLADDHPMVRAGIRSLLSRADDITIVGEASNGRDALEMAEALKPDVLVLDVEMPILRGVEVAQRLRAMGSPVRILALSAYNDKQYILGMLASGAAGYLTKEEVPETIVEAVRGVARGEEGWVSQSVAERVGSWKGRDEAKRYQLSARELEVLNLVVQGKTNQDIGVNLGISKKTVEKHLSSIFSKLGVSSRLEAVDYALRERILFS